MSHHEVCVQICANCGRCSLSVRCTNSRLKLEDHSDTTDRTGIWEGTKKLNYEQND